jgi:hypothetical protein
VRRSGRYTRPGGTRVQRRLAHEADAEPGGYQRLDGDDVVRGRRDLGLETQVSEGPYEPVPEALHHPVVRGEFCQVAAGRPASGSSSTVRGGSLVLLGCDDMADNIGAGSCAIGCRQEWVGIASAR